MAVIDSILGISVVVCVDEQALAEYDDDDFNAEKSSNMISKYIQSDILKEFAVRLAIEPPYSMNCPTLGFQIYVDGIKVREPLLRKAVLSRGGGHWESLFNGIKYSTGGQQPDCIIRPFKFSEIQTSTDDERLDSLHSDIQVMGAVGEIVIKVLRRTEAQLVGPKIEQGSLLDDLPSTVHEKALKGEAKSHGTKLGDGRASVFSRRFESEFMDGEDHPIAIFRFKYRSREALKSLLVIRSPEPEQAPEQAPVSRTASPELAQQNALNITSLSPSDRRQIQDFFQMLKSGAAPRNPEGKQMNHADRVSVKREREEDPIEAIRSRKKSRKRNAPVSIDLTLD